MKEIIKLGEPARYPDGYVDDEQLEKIHESQIIKLINSVFSKYKERNPRLIRINTGKSCSVEFELDYEDTPSEIRHAILTFKTENKFLRSTVLNHIIENIENCGNKYFDQYTNTTYYKPKIIGTNIEYFTSEGRYAIYVLISYETKKGGNGHEN